MMEKWQHDDGQPDGYSPPAADGTPPCDVNWLQEISSGDAEFLRELINLFLEDTPEQIEALAAALAGGDAEGVRSWAHTLKGASASFGAEPLRQLFYELETAARQGQLDDAPALLARARTEFEQLRGFLNSMPIG